MASSRHGTGADTDKILTSPDARHERTACAARHGRHGRTWAAACHGTDGMGTPHGPGTAGTARTDNAAQHGMAQQGAARQDAEWSG